MKTLGLTGGIGMGKSACAGLLRARGVQVIDTDDLAREIVEPGQPALAEVLRLFGPEIVDSEGQLRRGLLARRVFSDPQARKDLENILHPRIRAQWREQVRAWQTEGLASAVVVIPLLFETKAETELDAVICTACSSQTQLQRLRARDWSAEEIDQRIRAQWPTEEKMARSNYVIWTDSSLDVHAAQLDRILRF